VQLMLGVLKKKLKHDLKQDEINAINSISPSSSWGLLRPSSCLRRAGLFYLRKSFGSLAMFAAILRSSSRVSGLAVEHSLSECMRRPVQQRLWL
jgi:hypothetical protein